MIFPMYYSMSFHWCNKQRWRQTLKCRSFPSILPSDVGNFYGGQETFKLTSNLLLFIFQVSKSIYYLILSLYEILCYLSVITNHISITKCILEHNLSNEMLTYAQTKTTVRPMTRQTVTPAKAVLSSTVTAALTPSTHPTPHSTPASPRPTPPQTPPSSLRCSSRPRNCGRPAQSCEQESYVNDQQFYLTEQQCYVKDQQFYITELQFNGKDQQFYLTEQQFYDKDQQLNVKDQQFYLKGKVVLSKRVIVIC